MIVLFVPWIVLAIMVIAIILVFSKHKKWSSFCFFIVLLLNWFYHLFALNVSRNLTRQDGALRIMTFNMNCNNDKFFGNVNDLVELIMSQNADVVFLTEYKVSFKPEVDSILRSSYDYRYDLKNSSSYSIAYSKISMDPIKHYGGYEHLDNAYGFRFLYNQDSIGLYAVHLRSNNHVGDVPFYPENIRNGRGLLTYLHNYETASMERKVQMKGICSSLPTTPSIIIGDMNDVFGSPALDFLKESGYKDAWWECGFGYGATIHEPLPYRIDHMLYSKGLTLKGIMRVPANGLSDHDALVADFEIDY